MSQRPLLEFKFVAIETGPGLVCRTRYDRAGEKISEHAKGNVIVSWHFLKDGVAFERGEGTSFQKGFA
jgi:hypothetical protein